MIVEASEEAAQRNEKHQEAARDKQGDSGVEQQPEKRSRTGASGDVDNRDGDRGATNSQDPEGSSHRRKRAGGTDTDEGTETGEGEEGAR